MFFLFLHILYISSITVRCSKRINAIESEMWYIFDKAVRWLKREVTYSSMVDVIQSLDTYLKCMQKL